MKPDEGTSQLDSLFAAQREAHRRAPFPDWPTRRDRLQRLLALVLDNQQAIEDAIDADFGGRPRMETQIAEIFPSVAVTRTALRWGRRWMRRRRAHVSKWFLPARAEIVPRPLGVIGIVATWNYPLFLTVGPLVDVLAAGNRAMIKPSEHSPAYSALLARLVAERFAPDEIAVVTGGPETGAAFTALPFDHLVFTGGTEIGRKVMRAAADNLTPVTLELGGKSPTVIAPGFPLERAVPRILAGKLLNAGQTCIAPDYAFVPRDRLEDFVEAARAKARAMHPKGLADRDYCSVVDARQYARLLRYLDEAREAGVRRVDLFEGPDRDDPAHRLAPVVLVDPPASLAVMRDEIFGPILPVLSYDRLDDAVDFVEAMPRPLALYWFDDDAPRARQAIARTHVGGACINDTLMHVVQEGLPFGGIGASGMGHYHGRWGFDSFSKLTPVFRQSRWHAMNLFAPPYRPFVRTMLGWMKRL
ncbi:MAG: coniferyl aldehyde dehydrogenase [Burkholderiales bacterium]|jgi:coniferyl-aldehyde dehydrogenase|nr:MAG: coniferyl aldehyde dehydrogenase [Burkholderiales bacterium]